MMKCGCVAQGRRADGSPICTSHWNLTPDAEIVMDPPDLSNRQAKCPYCGELADSKNWERLPFFSYQPDREYDSFYNLCRGCD